MNSKTDKPGSMDRLFAGLIQVNQQPEQVPQGAAEETGEKTASSKQEQREEEIRHLDEVAEEPRQTRTKNRRSSNHREQFLLRADEDLMLKTRQLSFIYNLSLSDIINFALRNFITSYEAKYGAIRMKGNRISIDIGKLL